MEQANKDIADIKREQAKHNQDDLAYQKKNDEQNKAILVKVDTLIVSQTDFHEKMQPMAEWFVEMNLGKRMRWEWVTSGTKIGGFIAVTIVVLTAVWTSIKFLISQALIK